MKDEMLSLLQRRYSDMGAVDFLALATIIDPRYKDKFFTSSDQELRIY